MSFKPMLAPQDDPLRRKSFFKDLPYPLLVSPKYDGIRGVPVNDVVVSRTVKPLPSYQVQKQYSKYEYLDFEIIEGDPCDEPYNRTQSHVMSRDKPGDLQIFVFDTADPSTAHLPFYSRLDIVKDEVAKIKQEDVTFVEHYEANNETELLEIEEKFLDIGFEGVMMRTPWGRYKYNRCTWNDEIIYKLKRFIDDEGVIVGFEEQQTNTNTLERDERGYAKRSTKKEGMVAAGTLGKFLVEWKGEVLKVAPGAFKHPQRKEIFENPKKYLYQLLKFRYFGYGIKNLPRQPRAIGFRNPIDM